MRLKTLAAGGAFVAAAFTALPAPATTAATPAPAATPLRTITHERVSPLCTGLRRNIGPAIRAVLQNDRVIANSKPLFHNYVRDNATAMSQAAQTLDVSHLEALVGPLVKNTQEIKRLLNDPYVFPKVAISDGDRQLLTMRAELLTVLSQQEQALDLINGFVATEQMGELQQSGHEYDKAISSLDKTNSQAQTAQSLAPTPPPSGLLAAGVPQPMRSADPRFQQTGNVLGANPLNAFEQMVGVYQQQLAQSEGRTAQSVMQAVPQCGGGAPVQPSSAPSPRP